MNAKAITLNNGVIMPSIGLGTWRLDNSQESFEIMLRAIKNGYRMIDTAAMYGNEQTVGRAVRTSGVAREELFVVTKLHNDDQGYQSALQAYEASLERLGLDYADLYLIHSPTADTEKFVESWRAMEELYQQKRVRAIGVSNFWPAQLEVIKKHCAVTPAVNQILVNPYIQQKQTRQYCRDHGITVQSYSPLAQGDELLLHDEVITRLSAKYHKAPSQIVLRWHIQNELAPLPKTGSVSRLKENFDIFDFKLDAEDLQLLADLDTQPNVRI